MPQYGDGHLLDVFNRNGEATVHGGERFAAVDEELPRAGASAPVDQLANKFGCRFIARSSGPDERSGILNNQFAHGDRGDELLQIEDGP